MKLSRTGILAHQLKAARALARMDQQELAGRSGVSVPTIKRMESGDRPIRGTYENVAAVVATLEAAGVEFINGDKPGVQLVTQPGDVTRPASYKAVVKSAAKLVPKRAKRKDKST
jgi:transcriptional regulator with XRE-family HTH domain